MTDAQQQEQQDERRLCSSCEQVVTVADAVADAVADEAAVDV